MFFCRFSQASSNRFAVVFSGLGGGLTRLTIQYGADVTLDSPHRLYDIMDACPHLMALSVLGCGVDPARRSKRYPERIKLDLITIAMHQWTTTSGKFSNIFQRLRLLSNTPTSRFLLLLAIDQSYPLLQQVLLSKHVSRYLPDIASIQYGNGLRVLELTGPQHDQRLNGGMLVRYLMNHCSTIESFGIGFGFDFSASNVLAAGARHPPSDLASSWTQSASMFRAFEWRPAIHHRHRTPIHATSSRPGSSVVPAWKSCCHWASIVLTIMAIAHPTDDSTDTCWADQYRTPGHD